jgi:regulator of replication initiation timing
MANNTIQTMINEKTEFQEQVRMTMKERDGAREDLKEMTTSRKALQTEKEAFAAQMKDKLNACEADLKEKKDKIE